MNERERERDRERKNERRRRSSSRRERGERRDATLFSSVRQRPVLSSHDLPERETREE